MKININGVIREMTEEELAEAQKAEHAARVEEALRPMSFEEVSAMVITAQINTIPVDDKTALRMKSFYPVWAENTAYSVGHKVLFGGKLWRTVQTHTSLVGWEPVNVPSLWEQINESHDGTLDDPIPYEGNMALENGKHYFQNHTIYLCTRDTVNPVYNPLSELVGIYVEEV